MKRAISTRVKRRLASSIMACIVGPAVNVATWLDLDAGAELADQIISGFGHAVAKEARSRRRYASLLEKP